MGGGGFLLVRSGCSVRRVEFLRRSKLPLPDHPQPGLGQLKPSVPFRWIAGLLSHPLAFVGMRQVLVRFVHSAKMSAMILLRVKPINRREVPYGKRHHLRSQ